MKNRFSRLEALYGNDKVNKLRNSKVLVIGLGGVGGYVVESLTRSGIGELILVDSDVVDITNINRQIIATDENIGKLKTECFKERIRSINPDCKVTIYSEFLDESNYLDILDNKVDFIVDAIDSVKSKELIIKYALDNDINIISSMGTGNRENPRELDIMDISKTSGDPIAKIIRKYLRDNNINKKFKVLCSHELPMKKIEDVIPSNSFVPSSAGLLISSYVIKELIKD